MKKMKKEEAEKEIQAIFEDFEAVTDIDKELLSGLSQGKLYELYVLASLLTDLKKRGFSIALTQDTLKFKGAPGLIHHSDPHFVVGAPNGPKLRLFVNIEFQTQGILLSTKRGTDRSAYHELDIVLVEESATGCPRYDEIYLAIECKSGKFGKNFLREVLGVRRELSLYWHCQPSRLTTVGGTPPVWVQAKPASEYWLAFIDDDGQHYRESPAEFGIELRHIEPGGP